MISGIIPGYTRRPVLKILFCSLLLLTMAESALGAEQIYQTEAAFLSEAFSGDIPDPDSLWMVGETHEAATRILGHEPEFLRTRYWQKGDRSVWILDEIGKDRPITTGFVIDNGRIASLAVLIFRESRGDEVRHPFFTDQFKGAGLTDDGRLDRPIDALVGATLSVNGIERLTRLALYLSLQIGDDSNG